MDNTYSWFAYSRFKWILVAVLAKLVLAILCNDKALVSHDGHNDFLCFWTSMASLVFGPTNRLCKSYVNFIVCEYKVFPYFPKKIKLMERIQPLSSPPQAWM